MRRAIALSALGLGTTSPNPPVGCVILDAAGRVAGEGHHERKGGPHAEVQALTAAGSDAAGGTAMVTLEPCNHRGRTPACHQALIDAGVARVVIAVIDPTSRGEGGAALLRAAGVDVEVGVLAEEALLALGPWLMALRERRPHVTWLYGVADEGLVPVSDSVADRARAGFDAVLRDGGRLEEGMPGAHGADVFSLPEIDPSADPLAVLSRLYESGVRSLLLHGGRQAAQPFLDARTIDRVTVHMAGIAASNRPEGDWWLMPPDFRLERVRKVGGELVIDAAYELGPAAS